MPRRPTSDDAVRAARFFLESFIRRTDSQDHILPKNDEFSPFSGFCRVFPQFAKKKDGGSATDGVSRAAFNKICLEYFDEGMRKPARNGNPGALESNLAQQRRHFLRGRWLDPADAEDVEILNSLLADMSPEQSAAASDLLVDFSRWKPGPAGRGGERVCRKRSASPGDSCEEESEEDAPQAGSKRRAMMSEGGHTQTHTHKRVSASGAKREAGGGGVCAAGRGTMLELLCMVASSVEEKSAVSSVGSESGDDASSERSSSVRHDVQAEAYTELRSPEGVQLGGEAQRYVAEIQEGGHGVRGMCASMCASSAAASAGSSAAAAASQPAQPARAEVPAPFANLFKPEAAVVDEGMVRYPVPGCAS